MTIECQSCDDPADGIFQFKTQKRSAVFMCHESAWLFREVIQNTITNLIDSRMFHAKDDK